jgi:hypothetical protein
MKKVLASSLVTAALLGTSAFAAPSIAENGIGDFLIAPGYFAQGSFETNLKVVNTDTTHSVVVRGVVRDSVQSNEIDFIIVLSPGDVWEGTIAEVDGSAMLTSSDDSNYNKYTNIYNRSETLSVDLAGYSNTGMTFNAGYVEFYPLVQFNELITDDDADGVEDVQKTAMLDEDGNVQAFTETLNIDKNSIVQRFEYLLDNDLEIADKFKVDTTIALANPVSDVLTGEVTISSTATKSAMTIPLLAMAGTSDSRTDIDLAGTTGPFSPAQDTVASFYFDDEAAVEALLAKNTVNFLFDNSGEYNNLLFAFWNDQSASQSREFSVAVRNLTECYCSCTAPSSVVVGTETVVTTGGSSTCLGCAPIEEEEVVVVEAEKADPISGSQADAPVVVTPETPTTYCTVNANNEFTTVSARDVIGSTYDCLDNSGWTTGWAKLTYTGATANSNGNVMIPTQMRARNVDGQWSYSWNYLSYTK